MAVIDRQKYIKELSRLLAGMAPADREAVLRGVNARFDEAGDDSAAIKALGSPTYAAVQVLRGYVAPDPEEHPEAWVVTPELLHCHKFCIKKRGGKFPPLFTIPESPGQS